MKATPRKFLMRGQETMSMGALGWTAHSNKDDLITKKRGYCRICKKYIRKSALQSLQQKWAKTVFLFNDQILDETHMMEAHNFSVVWYKNKEYWQSQQRNLAPDR